MNKCLSCGVELAPQSRFCGVCGMMQPSEPGNSDPGFIQTVITPSSSENLPLPPQSHMPLPPTAYGSPQQQQPYYPQPLPATSSPPPPPAHYSHPQLPQQQQPYNSYQQSLPAMSSPQLPPAHYSHPQLPQQQQPYSGYQQPLPATSSLQPSSTHYSNPQLAPHQGPWSGQQPVKRTRRIIPWIIVGLVIIMILGGIGIWAIIPRPQPTITVTSKYHDDTSNPAGAKDTKIHIDGEQFAKNSTITFLLDNDIIQDAQTVSDGTGKFTTTLTVTSDWQTGEHKLKARDASNNTTSTAKSLTICDQGDCGTPGLNNAPPNNATFSFAVISDDLPNDFKLTVTGSSSSKGGGVCSNHDGATLIATAKDHSYTINSKYSCQGTYKGGKITYSETLENRSYIDSSNKEMCKLDRPHVNYRQLNGQFTHNGTFEGKVIIDSIDRSEFTCIDSYYINTSNNSNGTWISEPVNTTNA